MRRTLRFFTQPSIAPLLCYAAIVFIAGCASVDSTMRSWLGRSETDLVTAWGKPATTEADGHGGRILTYYSVTDRVVNNDPATVERAAGLVRESGVTRGGGRGITDDVEANVTVRSSRQRDFWVDSRGTIYSCSWQSPPGLLGRTPQLRSASLNSR